MTESDGEDTKEQLKSKVAKWLATQGYPLEMYAARACEEAGLQSFSSWYYYDKESKDYREVDVFAHTERLAVGRNQTFEIALVLECKYTRGYSWVAFTGGRSMGSRAAFAQRFVPEHTLGWWVSIAKVPKEGESYPLTAADHVAHSLVRANLGSKNREDVAYGALISVTKAAAGIVYWHYRASKDSDQVHHSVVLPVLVLDAPLFDCNLSSTGDLNISEIPRCTLQWKNRLSATEMPTTIIEVVTKEALPEFLADIKTHAEAIVRLAQRPPRLRRSRGRSPRSGR